MSTPRLRDAQPRPIRTPNAAPASVTSCGQVGCSDSSRGPLGLQPSPNSRSQHSSQ
jgi:hypothetical protein